MIPHHTTWGMLAKASGYTSLSAKYIKLEKIISVINTPKKIKSNSSFLFLITSLTGSRKNLFTNKVPLKIIK
jgi:hypothetical protein